MNTLRAGQGERGAPRRRPIWVSGPDEPAGHPPRPREHLRGRLGTLGDLLQLRADQTRERQT